MSDYMSKIDDAIDEYKKLREKFQHSMKVELDKVFTVFFEENPEVKTISWAQYTPYFNDGDACTFGVGDIYFSETEYDEDEHSSPYDFEEISLDRTHPSYKACDRLSSILNSNEMEDVLYNTFGDHTWIVVNKDGATVLEYSHD